MSPEENILSKIKKLMNLTEAHGATPAEAANAAAKAQALLFEHNLTMSAVDTHELGGAKVERMEAIIMDLDANQSSIRWKRLLLCVIARNNFCKAITIPNTTEMHVVGKRSNVEVVEYMSEYLEAEIERLADDAASSQLKGKAAFKNSFSLGAVNTINTRLEEQAKKNETATAACTALVVQSKGELEKATKGFFPNLVMGRSSRIGNYGAYHAGLEAGKTISLHRGVGQTKQSSLLG